MSDTIETIAQNATNRAAALRTLAKLYPDACFDVLWDDGPAVPVLYCADALDRAEGVMVRICGKTPVLLPYLDIGKDDAIVRLFLLRDSMGMFYAQTVLDRLPLADVVRVMGQGR